MDHFVHVPRQPIARRSILDWANTPILEYRILQYSDTPICTYQSMSYCSISVSASNEQSCLEVENGVQVQVQVQTKANSIELWLKADF